MRKFLLADFFHQWRKETEASLRRGASHQQVSLVVSAQDAAHGPNNYKDTKPKMSSLLVFNKSL
jgi:hypothetical protein